LIKTFLLSSLDVIYQLELKRENAVLEGFLYALGRNNRLPWRNRL